MNENFSNLLVNIDTAPMIFSIELWPGAHALVTLQSTRSPDFKPHHCVMQIDSFQMELTCSPDSKEMWRNQGTRVLKCHLNFGHGDPTGSTLRAWQLGDVKLIDTRLTHISISRIREEEVGSLCLKLVRSGALFVESGEQVQRFRPGELVLVPDAPSIRQTFKEPSEVVSVTFSPRSLKERGFRFDARGYAVPDQQNADVRAIAGMIALVADQNGDTSEKMRRRQGGQLLELLDLLIESPLALSRRRSGEATLFRAKHFIAQNLRNPELNVSLIAAAVHASSSQLTRLFRADGQTLMRYVWDRRLALAAELLQQIDVTRLQMSEIAYRCGFSSPTHFSRAFKERYGVAPKKAAGASLLTSAHSASLAS